MAKLIELLDSAKFAERDQAQSALAKMGEGASGTIKAALGGKISIEMKGRLELLLRKSEATSATSLRHHRAVAMLEWIGTPDARAQLRALADGAPDARRTIEALAALKRQ